jgi:hypothetical protein
MEGGSVGAARVERMWERSKMGVGGGRVEMHSEVETEVGRWGGELGSYWAA